MLLTNYHMHTCMSDGKNTAEEMVLCALEKGFRAIGFSDHGFTRYDDSYCIKDEQAYIVEITRLKEKYKKDIQIYVGVEEDAFEFVDRSKFDYLLGSCHYIRQDEKYHSIDLSREDFEKLLQLFSGDTLALAESYYKDFCEYILRRKPDIVGHFDLITKYDELDGCFLHDERYFAIAEKYLSEALKSDCIFEVNTGAMARGYRTSPYPHERLLYVLKKRDAKILLSSDAHMVKKLDFAFEESKQLLKEVGFSHVYALLDGAWKKQDL